MEEDWQADLERRKKSLRPAAATQPASSAPSHY